MKTIRLLLACFAAAFASVALVRAETAVETKKADTTVEKTAKPSCCDATPEKACCVKKADCCKPEPKDEKKS